MDSEATAHGHKDAFVPSAVLAKAESARMRDEVNKTKTPLGMKPCPSKIALPAYPILVFTAILLLIGSGCKPPTREGISGTYFRSFRGITESLALNTNGTFLQRISYTNGGAWSATGSWKIKVSNVEFDKCYLTFDIEHDAVINPPRETYAFNLGIERDALSKSELEPLWLRQK